MDRFESFGEEYEQWVKSLRDDEDWTGPEPSPGSTLADYIEDHRSLITFMDYGGRKRWDGFHTAAHPSPSLSEPGDYAADRLLARGTRMQKNPREIGEGTPDWPSRKSNSTFDALPRKQRIRRANQMRHRRDKKVMRQILAHGASQAQAAQYAGTSRRTVRRMLLENAPELIDAEQARRAQMLRANSKWGWLIALLLVPPHKATIDLPNAADEAKRLRPYLMGHKQACHFRWRVKCLSGTAIQIIGEPLPPIAH